MKNHRIVLKLYCYFIGSNKICVRSKKYNTIIFIGTFIEYGKWLKNREKRGLTQEIEYKSIYDRN